MKIPVLVAGLSLVILAGCGVATPATSAPTSPASKPAAPTASTAASGKPEAAISSSGTAKPAASGLATLKGTYTTVSPTGGPLWTAKETGIFAKNGLDVSLTSVQATAAMPALTSNDTQFASAGAAEVASLDLQGGDVVMIAEGAALPIFSLFADKKYKTVQDLAGQTIGVTSIGAASDTAAHLFLRKLDMEDKVKIIGAGGSSPAILAALNQGQIAGAILIPPVTTQAEKAGYVELVNGVKLGVPYTQGSITVTRAFTRDRADVAKRLLTSYLQAWRFVGDPANKAEVLKIFVQYMKTNEADSESAYNFMLPLWQSQKTPYMTDEAIKNVLQFISDPKAKAADPKQFYDNSLLQGIAGA